MVEPSSSDVQSDELQYGSINDITQRLLLWGKRTGMGLLRVEFSSEFARQEVLQRLQVELVQLKVPFRDIVLPTYQQPAVVADELEKALDERQGSFLLAVLRRPLAQRFLWLKRCITSISVESF
jgi:hypothetical protein